MADDAPGDTKAVLDLGCGSGAWYVIFLPLSKLDSPPGTRIMEAAAEFPHCNAVAIDLVPMQSPYALLHS